MMTDEWPAGCHDLVILHQQSSKMSWGRCGMYCIDTECDLFLRNDLAVYAQSAPYSDHAVLIVLYLHRDSINKLLNSFPSQFILVEVTRLFPACSLH